MLITEKTWPLFASKIAQGDPLDYNEAAVERLMDRMDEHIIRVQGVHPQFKANNISQLIEFQSKADFEYYHSAWERYLIEKAKIEGDGSLSSAQGRFLILAQFTIFRKTAEWIHAPYKMKAMYESVNKHGNVAVYAGNFKTGISRAVEIAIQDYNIPRDKISIIWGGSAEKQTKKGAIKKQFVENEELMDLLLAQGIKLEDINLGDNVVVKDEKVYPAEWRMGSQTREARQFEIDQFMKGKTDYCFFTFKAGGVGLSLHHSDEYTNRYSEDAPGYSEWIKEIEEWNKKHPTKQVQPGKARRKESGYVVERDIPFITTKPRDVYVAPTYSAIELVQGLGRCPRLTSLSNTNQTLIYFRGTIEERVKAIGDIKLRSLSKVVKVPEQRYWDNIATGKDLDKEYRMIMEQSKQTKETNDEIIGDIGSEDEE